MQGFADDMVHPPLRGFDNGITVETLQMAFEAVMKTTSNQQNQNARNEVVGSAPVGSHIMPKLTIKPVHDYSAQVTYGNWYTQTRSFG